MALGMDHSAPACVNSSPNNSVGPSEAGMQRLRCGFASGVVEAWGITVNQGEGTHCRIDEGSPPSDDDGLDQAAKEQVAGRASPT